MSAVIIYNLGGKETLGIVSVKKAITMLHRGVARVHTPAEEGDRFGPYTLLKAVELVKYIFAKWKYDYKVTHYSKKNVLQRDKHICGYCGKEATTVDHIIPRCQKGTSTWLNSIASCKSCNAKKAGRTPEQAGMKLRFSPTQPA